MAWYQANSFHINTGSVDSGTKTDTYTENNVRHVLDEVNGTPGFNYEYWFTTIPAAVKYFRVKVNGFYDGNPSHIVYVQGYNNITLAWVTLFTMLEGHLDVDYVSPDIVSASFVTGGVFKLRFYHTVSGNKNHDLAASIVASPELRAIADRLPALQAELRALDAPSDRALSAGAMAAARSPAPVVALAGGVGAARFLRGLVRAVPADAVTAIVNTGDDKVFYGLDVSPDLDIVTYTLAGLVDAERGWGLAGDGFAVVDALARFGHETWFRLGDRDLATCLHRTLRLRAGVGLVRATDEIRRALGWASTPRGT